jgi:hypothetical protein
MPLTVTTPCESPPPIGLSALLKADFWNHNFYQTIEFECRPRSSSRWAAG